MTFQLILLNETEPSRMLVSDGMQYLLDKAETKEWWIMISFGAMDQILKIARTFYLGKPDDFIPAIAREGLLITIARKTRMSYKQFTQFLIINISVPGQLSFMNRFLKQTKNLKTFCLCLGRMKKATDLS